MDISQASITEAIERFVRSECQVAEDDPMFSRDAHLFDLGFVDSVGFAQLLAFIESTFGIVVEEGELFGEEFTTVNGMGHFVYSRLREPRTQRASREQ